jgi:hypothetical protein
MKNMSSTINKFLNRTSAADTGIGENLDETMLSGDTILTENNTTLNREEEETLETSSRIDLLEFTFESANGEEPDYKELYKNVLGHMKDATKKLKDQKNVIESFQLTQMTQAKKNEEISRRFAAIEAQMIAGLNPSNAVPQKHETIMNEAIDGAIGRRGDTQRPFISAEIEDSSADRRSNVRKVTIQEDERGKEMEHRRELEEAMLRSFKEQQQNQLYRESRAIDPSRLRMPPMNHGYEIPINTTLQHNNPQQWHHNNPQQAYQQPINYNNQQTPYYNDQKQSYNQAPKQPESKLLKLSKDVRKFEGKSSENIDDWLYELEFAMMASEIPPHKRLIVLGIHLEKTAHNVFRQHLEINEGINYKEMKEKLRKTFTSSNHKMNIRAALSKLTFTTVEKYIEEFRKMANELKTSSDTDKIWFFISNLPDDLYQKIKERECETLECAMNCLKVIEPSKPKTITNFMVNTNRSEIDNRYKDCTFCKKPGHNETNCRLKYQFLEYMKNKNSNDNPQNSRSTEQRRVSFARSPSWEKRNSNYQPNNERRQNYPRDTYKQNQSTNNEVARKNFDNKPKSYSANVIDTNEDNMGIQDEESTYENQIEPECFDEIINLGIIEINNIDGEFLTATTYVDGIQVEAHIDSCARRSVIPLNHVEKYGLSYKKTNAQCQLGDGSKIVIHGFTEKLHVEVHNVTQMISFIILDRHNMLLGVDWIVGTGAILDLKNQILTFPKQEIYCKLPPEIMDTNTIETDISVNRLECFNVEDLLENNDHWNLDPNRKVQLDYMFKEENLKHLTREQSDKLKSVVFMHKGSFAFSLDDLETPCDVSKHKINLTTDIPIRLAPYRRPLKDHDEIAKQISKLLDKKIIRRSRSAYAAPIVLVPKPDGSTRMCIDYKGLNKITVTDAFPMTRIDDIFDKLNGARFYSKLDLKSGYWQILMAEEDIHKTAFICKEGLYEWIRLPFGLKNAPGDFCRIMYEVLGDLNFVEKYIDDLIIFSPDFELHLEHIKIVLKRLKERNLKINPEKCDWAQEGIKVLGHIIYKNQIRMDLDKIKVVQNWETPKNVNHVQRFLGLVNYYRRFIKDFAKKAAPIFKVLKQDKKFEWTTDCDESFAWLKKKLTSYPILRQPDWTKEFILFCDASGSALGAILSQKDDKDQEYVVSYASRLLKGAEIHYGITEKECLAVIWATKLFRIYIYGQTFKIITDHSALLWLMKMKQPEGKLARWSLQLQDLTFEIIHKPGKKHQNADALSRMYNLNAIDYENEVSEKTLDPYEDEGFMHFLKTGKYLPGSSSKHCKRVQKLSAKYVLEEDILHYFPNIEDQTQTRVVPPVNDRLDIIKREHLPGHFSFNKIAPIIKEKYFWKNMNKDIDYILKTCIQCLRHTPSQIKDHPALALPITGLFDRIGIDCVFGLPKTYDNYCGILVITEYLSKYPYAVPIKSKEASEIAEHLFQYISLFGPPKELLSDQGKEFLNKKIDALLARTGVERTTTSAYNPRTNGLTERFNQTLVGALRKHSENNPTDWPQWLPYILMAYRSRFHPSIRCTPFELLFGRKMNHFEDWKSSSTDEDTTSLIKRTIEIKTLFEQTIPNTLVTLEHIQEKQKEHQDKIHNVILDDLKSGDKVLILIPRLKPKMEPKYMGPYTIDEKTENGNFWLLNMYDRRMPTSYPRNKLKKVDNRIDERIKQDEVPFIIEKIQKDRVRNGIKEYFVTWVGKDSRDSCWIPENAVDNQELLNEYSNKRDYRDDEISINAIDSIKSENNSIKFNFSIVFCILFIITCIKSVHGSTLKDKFNYCIVNNNSPLLNIANMCKNANNIHENHDADTYFLLEKRLHKVDGYGHVCTAQQIVVETHKSIFGNKWHERIVHDLTLSKVDCLSMQMSNRCFGFTMNCIDNSCFYKNEPELKYEWASKLQFTSYHCRITKQRIQGNQLNKPLFGNADSSCLAKNLFCQIGAYTYIWDSNIIHECPFLKNKEINLTISENIALGDKLLFQIKNKIHDCNMNILETTEGFYLTKDRKADKLELSEFDLNVRNHMILADFDFKNHEIISQFIKVANKVSLQLCSSYQSMLQIYGNLPDRFITIYDINNIKTILFNDNGEIIIPTCHKINEITLTISTNCYDAIPIIFKYRNKKVDAFISDNGIIHHKAKLISCDSNIKIPLPSHNYTIFRGHNKTILSKLGTRQHVSLSELINFNRNELNNIYNHEKETSDNIDIFVNRNALDIDVYESRAQNSMNIYNTSYTLSEIISQSGHKIVETGSQIVNYTTKLTKKIIYTIIGISILVIVSGIIILIIRKSKQSRYGHRINLNDEEIPLEERQAITTETTTSNENKSNQKLTQQILKKMNTEFAEFKF